jgi:hypothetical protein
MAKETRVLADNLKLLPRIPPDLLADDNEHWKEALGTFVWDAIKGASHSLLVARSGERPGRLADEASALYWATLLYGL